jgi:hypothetical protein
MDGGHRTTGPYEALIAKEAAVICMAYGIGPRQLDGVTPAEWAAMVEVARETGRVR